MDAEVLSAFDNEYFETNKKLLILSGLWPYTNTINKIFKRILFLTVFVIVIVPNINGARIWCGKDFAICGENIAGVLYMTGVITKYLNSMFCEKKIKNVCKLLGEKWFTVGDADEKKILRMYAQESKRIGTAYIGYLGVSALVFSQSSMVNTFLDLVYPLNETRPKFLPVKGEFFCDPYAHHFKIYLMYNVSSLLTTVALLGIDITFVVVVYQSLATLSIVQHRLTKASDYYVENKGLGYRTIISAIRMHKDALQFLNDIESSYGICLLLIVTLTGVFVSLIVVVILEYLDNPVELMKFTLLVLGMVFHLFYISWPGQKVMDHSSELFLHIYRCKWYNMCKKGKNLMKILMLRCSRISTLTACGFYVMNFENFAIIIKTTMSYVTVAISIEE